MWKISGGVSSMPILSSFFTKRRTKNKLNPITFYFKSKWCDGNGGGDTHTLSHSTHTHTHSLTHTHTLMNTCRLVTLRGTQVPPMSSSLSVTTTRSSSGTRRLEILPSLWRGCTLISSTPSLGATTAATWPLPVRIRRSGSLIHAKDQLSRWVGSYTKATCTVPWW